MEKKTEAARSWTPVRIESLSCRYTRPAYRRVPFLLSKPVASVGMLAPLCHAGCAAPCAAAAGTRKSGRCSPGAADGTGLHRPARLRLGRGSAA